MGLFSKLLSKRRAPTVPVRVGIRTGSVVTEVGASSILHALFSTISANLEPQGWGTRFPTVLGPLYQGHLAPEQCGLALSELQVIHTELSAIPVDRVVWDIERPSERPHPAFKPNHSATSAAEYFITVNGRDLLRDGLIDSLESAVEFGDSVQVVSFAGPEDFLRSNA